MATATANPRNRRNTAAALGFLLPNFLGFLLFTTFPVLFSLVMSFTNWSPKPTVDLRFVGLDNFVQLVHDRYFWFYFYNTAYFMLGIPLSIAGSLFLAVILSKPIRLGDWKVRAGLTLAFAAIGAATALTAWASGNRDAGLLLAVVFALGALGVLGGNVVFRTTFYLPHFTAGVALIILWMQLYNPHFGLINGFLERAFAFLHVGGELPTWLSSTKSLLGLLPLPDYFNNEGFGLGAREAIMFMGIWTGIGGNNMLLYLAGISNIPLELYEAADIDGAGKWAKFRHVTWPQLAPTTFFIVVMSTIGGLQGGFEQARVMTQGGPAGITTTLSYYIYTVAFEQLKLGYASAVAWVLFVIIFALTLLNWKYGNRHVNY
ncbi:MAG: hypothetical protein COZ06_10875 [Armatimonadetes bacterium CG_4_10_14_3_um_filter_66_18]|nr:sugar ABC transporter permease [Armatimonadota bacterium]OIP09036.1 MAG: hypothetical protein AUJ96_05665 [Armatimonadetes bacterium CG2_30_66_41]PIU88373.1 MAG: hypothetical protein COS65_30840 [Armatimonadetes bacterium CG06_land_8_20_14_3_00_66_21]PIX46904.1 MAG: hypothetical protein COZ57_09950 [Armatimonadetes bacterium CG_4_8_14_3_um_filter_66_20]PIY50141.1 MAG: hypothetical protein COZ06_10875 [Armatimonadetes bacterium CG_4_10_14_3_um_filter_66_18]PIZ51585.1 MAG: hypothetical protei